MNADIVFRRLIEFERAIADLYRHWASLFSDDTEASIIWRKMANEELGHANLIAYQRRVFKSNPKLATDTEVALEEVLMLMDIVRRSLEGPPHSLAEAVRLACWIETSVAEGELKSSVQESNPEVQKLLDHLGADDRQHRERLMAFAEKRGIPLLAPQEDGPTQP